MRSKGACGGWRMVAEAAVRGSVLVLVVVAVVEVVPRTCALAASDYMQLLNYKTKINTILLVRTSSVRTRSFRSPSSSFAMVAATRATRRG